ncbi:hypothetical protein BDV25DRAFT_162336 [Aspergillus avenaceus]|uniref:Uncharacterized protein n=1 Tax=Aspergillus avenaceus TaxID=36643 RepID=A0A5N6TJF2_ASPAV|nr:hypothetical protein BDV25DRAFT_162336 [Aspergillus avenaceus]
MFCISPCSLSLKYPVYLRCFISPLALFFLSRLSATAQCDPLLRGRTLPKVRLSPTTRLVSASVTGEFPNTGNRWRG